jgi:hypothetical protein
MSDFDTVLERLLVDPAFKAVLAADPAAALAGYRLSADELELLGSQLSTGDGQDRTVEMRSSKSSMFGLLSPLEGLATGGAGGHPSGEAFNPTANESAGVGRAGGSALQGLGDRLGPALGAPGAAEAAPTGFPGAAEAFGGAGGGAAEGFGAAGAGAVEGFGGAGGGAAEGFGGGHGVFGGGRAAESFGGGGAAGGDHIPVGYHPHVDADGDGRWDKYLAIQHTDGSVDIYEDRNHDGLVDFIGHDRNADGIIDSADYDEDFDGVADTRMTDVNGDGWMDTRTPIVPPGS